MRDGGGGNQSEKRRENGEKCADFHDFDLSVVFAAVHVPDGRKETPRHGVQSKTHARIIDCLFNQYVASKEELPLLPPQGITH
ncbi:MAG: hypothetical protein Q4F72_01510, partial [Desulfovibrionaceae bacterium]|nr:hypothetical protein [Desulfovibrionaceae bacterium]